ncbi:MAG: CRISPR-associated helicase/endonuclease Cas3 [Cycloclasticus sp.]|nr:MAG: CRISPR-associated helicase/endonuclease Cas3 [Cycloclasticus sp.]
MKLNNVNKYWAKYQKEDDQYHLFTYHCLDVVAVADVWLSNSSVLLKQAAKQIELDVATTKRVILFFVAIHDLGKLDARFQSFVPELRGRLQGSKYEVVKEAYQHGTYGYLHFKKEFCSSANMAAVAGHHGHCDKGMKYFLPDADEELVQLDISARKQWVEFCLDLFDLEVIPDLPQISCLAGLCSVSDWRGSSMTNFTQSPVDNKSYYSDALLRAEEVLKKDGLIGKIKGSGFDYLFGSYKPRGIQTLLDSLPVKAGLTIVEADTGSGKTEFALSYASTLISAGLADGIVFGLPTQATANGLFGRIGNAAEKLFPDMAVTLAHGHSKYVISDENGFLHQSNKRAFLGSMSVATIDQILMGALGIKHQFIRSFGTQKSVLILDEIHAFDQYMYALITKILQGQHDAYSSVILLSATLPVHLKDQLLNTYKGESNNNAYPLVTHVEMNGEVSTFELSSKTTNKKIKSEIWVSPDLLPNKEQIKRLIDWSSNGAVVGVICNTVIDAQLLYKMVLEQDIKGVEVDLFHARFAMKDRQRIEKNVLKNYGKEAIRKGRLLIATQVIEQSLDLDFDVLVSQIAPAEFLMQRMGRLWRHDRNLPNSVLAVRSEAIKEPLFITLCPSLEDVEKCLPTSYTPSSYVYQNIRVLYRTHLYLIGLKEWDFPSCYRVAIDKIHDEEPHKGESSELSEIAIKYENEQSGKFYAAKNLTHSTSTPLSDVDPRCALLTRDGEMSLSVVLFNEDGLLHGGDYDTQADREDSTVSLSRKYAKGSLDTDLHCLKAVVGRDISYCALGVFDEGLEEKFNARSD